MNKNIFINIPTQGRGSDNQELRRAGFKVSSVRFFLPVMKPLPSQHNATHNFPLIHSFYTEKSELKMDSQFPRILRLQETQSCLMPWETLGLLASLDHLQVNLKQRTIRDTKTEIVTGTYMINDQCIPILLCILTISKNLHIIWYRPALNLGSNDKWSNTKYSQDSGQLNRIQSLVSPLIERSSAQLSRG